MSLSILDDKSVRPTQRLLREVLGKAYSLWTALENDLEKEYGPLAGEWSYSGQAYGWFYRIKSLRTKAKRTVVYMTPQRSSFLASFALGEKACARALSAGLSPALLKLIDAAPRYAEGRGVRIPVRTAKDLREVLVVAACKMTT